jgi:hypothetical protein
MKYEPHLARATPAHRPLTPLPHLTPLLPIAYALFHFPYPLSPVFATLTKTTGVCTNNSHSGTRHSPIITRHFPFSRFDFPFPLRPFRMNTCESVSKQMTLTSFRINTYEEHRGRGGVIVNQIPDEEICPEEHRDEGSLSSHATKHPYPERVQRVDPRFRLGRRTSLRTRRRLSIPSG